MMRLRLLHFSDLHLAVRYKRLRHSVCKPEILEEIARLAYFWRNNIDGILISGDIADFGRQNDIERAKEFTFSPPHLTSKKPWLNLHNRPTLQACNKPIILIPGNHDRFANQFFAPSIHMFNTIFSIAWSADRNGVQSTFLPNDSIRSLAIICADFCLEQIGDCSIPGGHLGQGMVYDNRLKELISQTEKITNSNPSTAVIWIVHFAPKIEDHFRQLKCKHLKLLDSHRLIKEAKDLNVRHIFCGHTHYRTYYNAGDSSNVCWIHCGGTSTCHRKKDGFESSIHIRDIEINGRSIERVRSLPFTWDSEYRRFSIPEVQKNKKMGL